MVKQELESMYLDSGYFETDENAFICSVCNSAFDNENELKGHLIQNGFIL